jgi:nucleotide-binding universal stress UspA family protein
VSQFKKILVPTDFSPAATEAFRTAVALAKASGGEVIAVHVTRAPTVVVENGGVTPSAGAVSANLWDRFRPLRSDDPAVPVAHEIVAADRVSAARILSLLEKFGCDLLVIGSHGHGRLRRFFRGSLTDEVVRRVRCPVVVVKTPAPGVPSAPVPQPAHAGGRV